MTVSASHSSSPALDARPVLPATAAATVKGPRRYGRLLYLAINIAILAFLLAPIAIVVVFALNPTPFIQFPPVGVSLRWFEKFFASRDFMHALVFSLEVAVLTTVCATLLGASAALALARGNLPGTRLIRVESRPGPYVARDALDYLKRAPTQPPRRVFRQDFRGQFL